MKSLQTLVTNAALCGVLAPLYTVVRVQEYREPGTGWALVGKLAANAALWAIILSIPWALHHSRLHREENE